MSYLIRPMLAGDLAAVLAVQADAYADHFHESLEVINARLLTCADTAWVAEKSGNVCAYLVAYKSCVGKIAALNTVFVPARNPDCLYLHDLAIARLARGAGLARHLLLAAEKCMDEQGLAHMALISVQDSKVFWAGFGFEEFAGLDIEQEENLRGYGDKDTAACYMVKKLVLAVP